MSKHSCKKVNLPSIIYGTAWKKDKTSNLVSMALEMGFRGVDTACQPKHYNERLVGEGIVRSGISRDEIFIQTKFTPMRGQDPNNIPYDPNSSLEKQIKTSFEVSQENLNTERIDSLVLHSPLPSLEETLEAWEVFEDLVEKEMVSLLGLSNCHDPQFFTEFFQRTRINPSFLQNRLYEESGYDRELRSFCLEKEIVYQSFWTLTANPHILNHPIVQELAAKFTATAAQIFFYCLSQNGIIPLTGTSSKLHMEQDLNMVNLELSPEQVASVMKLLHGPQ